MLFDPATANHLKPWLVRTLEPICDAEPGALADYILALLKHNAPEAELRKELIAQLEEFLEKECSPFIDTLFTALRTKSYLPYSDPLPPPTNIPSSSQQSDQGIPIPLDAILPPPGPSASGRTRKRSMEIDDRDSRPTKGPRLGDEGHYSRFGRPDGRSSWGNRGDRGSRMGIDGRPDYMDGGAAPGMDTGMNGVPLGPRGSYRPPERRGICRDYHNTGYCARGAFCKYSHGDDAIVPTQLFPMGGAMPSVPMLANGAMPYAMQGGAYDPRERMDIRQPVGGSMMGRQPISRPAVMPRQGDTNGAPAHRPGELPVIQDLTPEVPSEERYQSNQTGDSRPDMRVSPIQANGGANGVQPPSEPNGDVEMPAAPTPQNGRHPHPHRGGYRGGGNGGGRGVFSDVASFRPERRDDKTLVVEKIPENKLSLGSVNEWFSKFGTVTNVAVDAVNAKALVSFSTHDEAYKAWKSEDAVFGNRFVKVFWHRPMEGHGHKGARMLAASAPLVANISSVKEAVSTPPPPAQPSTSTPPATSAQKAPSAAASALAAKQQLLEQQIAEQKSLMAKLSSASPQEKKEIMARLRKLNEEMKPPSAPSIASQSRQASSSSLAMSNPTPHPAESVKKELLDRELDMHIAVKSEDDEESTEDLKAKLAKLKAEAASLGLSDVSETTPYSGGGHSYRPYRGRGRGGRSYYRGAMRGGPPRTNMKLDNRPKKLLVQDAGEGALQAVRDWYETTGQVESAETVDGGGILISFKTRLAAEQGLAKGTNIATVGPIRVSWFTGQQSAPSTNKGSTSWTPNPDPKHLVKAEDAHDDPLPSSGGILRPTPSNEDKMYDEEEEGHGWGGEDGEEGFGML